MTIVVENLIKNVVAWAAMQPQLRAIVLVGSQARGTARPDSDVDLVVLSQRPEDLLKDLAWTRMFGTVIRETKEHWGRLTSVRVWYEPNLEVEFGVTTVDWGLAPDEGTLSVLRDGIRVLLDRDGIFAVPIRG